MSMHRICPSCEKPSISVFQLMFTRVNCKNCKEKISHHWLYSTILICIEAPILILIGLYFLQAGFSLTLSLSLFFLLVIFFTFISSRLCPLEIKKHFLEPLR